MNNIISPALSNYNGDFQRRLRQYDWANGFKDLSTGFMSSGETFMDMEELEMCHFCGKGIRALDDVTVQLLNHVLQRELYSTSHRNKFSL